MFLSLNKVFFSLLINLKLNVICTISEGPDLFTKAAEQLSQVTLEENACQCGNRASVCDSAFSSLSASGTLQNSHFTGC